MPRVFRTDGTEVLSLTEAAYQLGRDGVLSDPDTDTILVAAAELAGSSRDLYNLDRHFVIQIVAAFDRGDDEHDAGEPELHPCV